MMCDQVFDLLKCLIRFKKWLDVKLTEAFLDKSEPVVSSFLKQYHRLLYNWFGAKLNSFRSSY